MLSFYVAAGILGQEEQMAVLADFMMEVRDETLQSLVVQQNEKHFKSQMLEHLNHYRLLLGIYGEADRVSYMQHLARF